MRMLSYNIHKGIGGHDRLYRIERIIHVIQAERPDLVCLQEVDRHVRRSKFDDQPMLLAERLGAVADLYQLNVPIRGGGYGNLVLSRWPIVGRHQISLRLKQRKPRGAQMAVVETPEGPLHLVNFHLGLVERERHWQVNHLLHHHLYREAAHLPTLIAGDFNDWRNTLGRGPLARHGLVQVTAPLLRFRSFPAYFPMGSLDKVFASPRVRVAGAHVVRNRLARRASDHLPIIVDFHLESSPSGPGHDVRAH